jgi:hypothetical protein
MIALPVLAGAALPASRRLRNRQNNGNMMYFEHELDFLV